MRLHVFTLLSCFTLLTISCNLDNSDYPRRVHFGPEGGIKIVTGDGYNGYLSIEDGSQIIGVFDPYYYYDLTGDTLQEGDVKCIGYVRERNGTTIDTCGLIASKAPWLKLATRKEDSGSTFAIIAQPNKSRKKRKAFIRGMELDLAFDIVVTQSGN